MKVVFLACTFEYGFGFGANITKVGYMAKGLKEAGATCTIHNGIVGSTKIPADQCVEHDGFKVTTYRQRGSVHISWLRNICKLYKYLKNEHIKGERNIAIVELDLYHIMLVYYIMLKILGYKIVTISHEWGPIVDGLNKMRILSHKLFANTFGWFSDGILPISEYIIEKIKHFKKPYLKLPIMADFENSHTASNAGKSNFLYCAGIGYIRIIKMIIEAYTIYHKKGGSIGMTLIINGPEYKIKELQDYIATLSLDKHITIRTKLPYNELLNEYCSARALLIPLDPENVQDKARFSQKLAEYLSSKSPIITNDVGEIKYYFNDNEIIKCKFTHEAFAEKFNWIENNPQEALQIGVAGYERGRKEFDYRKLGKDMYEFFKLIPINITSQIHD